jgi:hypothetical protein
MAGPALLQALQRELAIEKAARQELEVGSWGHCFLCNLVLQMVHMHHDSSGDLTSLFGTRRRKGLTSILFTLLQKQTVLKTRQLWHLREQQDKETKQYQVDAEALVLV